MWIHALTLTSLRLRRSSYSWYHFTGNVAWFLVVFFFLLSDSLQDMIAGDVVNPDHMDVEFDSIGWLDGIKETLFQLAILPLRRPEFFCHGKLLGPTKGVLLYGPPGTGKTMLAKGIAKGLVLCS